MVNEERAAVIRELLRSISTLAPSEAILLEHEGTPVGVTSTARVAVLATTFATAVANSADTDEEIVHELSRLWKHLYAQHDAAEVPHLLWATLLITTTLHTKPALDRLAELGDDWRPNLLQFATAIAEATDDDWEAASDAG